MAPSLGTTAIEGVDQNGEATVATFNGHAVPAGVAFFPLGGGGVTFH